MKQDQNHAYGYAVINGVLRLWGYDYKHKTANNYVSWSSQELEYLARDKKEIFNFLDKSQLPT